MKAYDTPRATALDVVENDMIAASLVIDNNPGEWEGDAHRKGWNADDWSGTGGWDENED